jgi:hypothetical protein
MPRVSGDTDQVGSAWLASAPPLGLTESLQAWLLGRNNNDDPEQCTVRAAIARSTTALRRLARGRAA